MFKEDKMTSVSVDLRAIAAEKQIGVCAPLRQATVNSMLEFLFRYFKDELVQEALITARLRNVVLFSKAGDTIKSEALHVVLMNGIPVIIGCGGSCVQLEEEKDVEKVQQKILSPCLELLPLSVEKFVDTVYRAIATSLGRPEDKELVITVHGTEREGGR
jgi:hypothetical protein